MAPSHWNLEAAYGSSYLDIYGIWRLLSGTVGTVGTIVVFRRFFSQLRCPPLDHENAAVPTFNWVS